MTRDNYANSNPNQDVKTTEQTPIERTLEVPGMFPEIYPFKRIPRTITSFRQIYEAKLN